jgi:hypothetical protein
MGIDMKMTIQFRFVFFASLVLCSVGSAYAIFEIAEEGQWPKTWPKELEPFRKQSCTVIHASTAIYEIPFSKREEFESAWPHIAAPIPMVTNVIIPRHPASPGGHHNPPSESSPRKDLACSPEGHSFPTAMFLVFSSLLQFHGWQFDQVQLLRGVTVRGK